MDKREALEIYLKVTEECGVADDCDDCVFSEPFKGDRVCILDYVNVDEVAMSVREKLKLIDEKQEEHSVPPKNVEVKTTLYAKAPISAEELEKQLKALLPKKLALEPLPKEDRAIKMPESSKPDNVNQPAHYLKGGMECIDVIKAVTSDLSGADAYYVGNIIKYVWRYNNKNGIEDLRKAKHYLEWLIKSLEG